MVNEMKKQVFNPFLPLNEYIPDGEPHVFGDRVYIYGSHDKANSDRFCVQDYTVYSAPVDDLSDWKCHGVTYKKSQDLRSRDGRPPEKYPDYYAPDCVKGNDGRYYLYYVAMGPNVHAFGPMSVAVADSPAGPFEYLGDLRNRDGTPLLTYLTNDPAVINDNGNIYMYYGWSINRDFRTKAFMPLYNLVQSKLFQRSIKEIKETEPSIMGCVCCEMEDDMLTVRSQPKMVLHSNTTADKNSEYYKHAFYEAASIRKFDDLYYLVYSSGVNNELAYATSRYPDRDFKYRGVIISNSDMGLNGNKKPKNVSGTIHGGIEKINGKFYIFYHRCTNNTDFSRQACAEEIKIEKDGLIKQVEVTSCGLNSKALEGKGTYPASICCQLYGNKMKKIGLRNHLKHCRITEENGEQFICDIDNSTVVGYKYFDFNGETEIGLKVKGDATGKIEILTDVNENALGTIEIKPVSDKTIFSTKANLPCDKSALYLRFSGTGKFNFFELKFEKKE